MSEIVVSRADRRGWSHRKEHPLYEYRKKAITSRAQFDRCYAAFYKIPPRKSAYPYHYHEQNDEVFYILSGKGIFRTPTGTTRVKKGDVVVCPRGKAGAHKITNLSYFRTLRYLDIDTTDSPDTIHYPDSDKIGIVRHNESFVIYKNGAIADYYDGE